MKNHTHDIIRCSWPGTDDQLIHYHDTIWGVPEHDDREIFKAIVLDTNQAGLSWKIIWHKRTGFARAYANFDPQKVAKFTEQNVQDLMNDPGIIRNRLKIKATITNAQAFLDIQKEFGTFAEYIWSFVDGQTIHNGFNTGAQIPARTEISDRMSVDMKKRGFKFVGSTICYAFMQGIGMVNDHTTDCFRYEEIKNEVEKNKKIGYSPHWL